MIVFIDIDDTICHTEEDTEFSPGGGPDYSMAKPIQENIDKCNWYYEQGHTVIYWTARGSKTGIDWKALTEVQFELWGVKYHELRLDKPYYDLLIDDKTLNPLTTDI